MTYQLSASIDKMLYKAEYNLAKIKAIKAIFPEALFSSSSGYADKSVNKEYTNWDFEDNYSGLVALPYYLLSFEFNGKQEDVKIRSIPRRNTMIYKNHTYNWSTNNFGNPVPTPPSSGTLSFSKFFTNMKNREFKEDMLQDCRTRIMKFISDNPKYTLDTKNLDSRLKKLLLFV